LLFLILKSVEDSLPGSMRRFKKTGDNDKLIPVVGRTNGVGVEVGFFEDFVCV
jgi:hypothetical protein